MELTKQTAPSGYLLPSIHSSAPFFTQQPNPITQESALQHWSRLILSYARFRRLFNLRVEDAEKPGSDWDEVLRNDRIKRRVRPSYLEFILGQMVAKGTAVYEPPKQTRSALLYWRLPEEWAEVLHDWASSTGQLNTILTLYEIIEPPVPSELSGIPMTILKKAISILVKSNRAQMIAVADGEGVRFLTGNPGR